MQLSPDNHPTGAPAEPGSGDEPDSRPGAGIEEVARAAARAFSLLPTGAEHEDPAERRSSALAQRLKTDPDTVERDLMKLVLTIVELLRQLMERTALHRVDQDDLSEEQEERIGMTLMVLHERMTELCERYGLTMADLNLDLGPLGSLLPTDDR